MAISRQGADRRRIVVIGPCASGKTSLATGLQRLGYDARACGQEHSEIAELWRHQSPDVLIGLHIALDTVRERRSATWPGAVFERQRARLGSGFRHADLVIECDEIDLDAVLAAAVGWLRTHPAKLGTETVVRTGS